MTTTESYHETEYISNRDLRKVIRDKVYKSINPEAVLGDLKRNPSGVRKDLASRVRLIVSEEGYLLPPHAIEEMQEYIIDEMLGYGPIEALLTKPEIEEVMVNKFDEIWVAERTEGAVSLKMHNQTFDDDDHVLHVVDRILSHTGRRVDDSNPRVDTRLEMQVGESKKRAYRVNVVIPPIALKGPTVTIRKFPEKYFTMHDLVYDLDTIPEYVDEFLKICVQGKLNILISGGTGSGKTTLLNALTEYFSKGERIVTIEDTAELQVFEYNDHVVMLEARPANIEGKGRISIRDLVVNSLRMRPDRIVVGEVRADETVDMLQAMNTGHDGSLTTVHANKPDDALIRLENMFLMSNMNVPVLAIRQQISTAIQLIVQLAKIPEPDGSARRKVTSIMEISGDMEGDKIVRKQLFTYDHEIGELVPSGESLYKNTIDKLRSYIRKLPSRQIYNVQIDDGDSE